MITFIRRIENLDYIEAVRFLAQRAGMEVPEGHADDGMAKLRSPILKLTVAARFYHSVLNSPAGAAGMHYLRDRALAPHTIRHFGLGYAPDSRFALCDHLTKRGYRRGGIDPGKCCGWDAQRPYYGPLFFTSYVPYYRFAGECDRFWRQDPYQ